MFCSCVNLIFIAFSSVWTKTSLFKKCLHSYHQLYKMPAHPPEDKYTWKKWKCNSNKWTKRNITEVWNNRFNWFISPVWKKIDKFTLTAIAVPTNLKTTPSYACQTEPLLVPGSNFYTKRFWENFLKIFWKSIRQKMLIVVWKHKFCGVKLGQIIFS